MLNLIEMEIFVVSIIYFIALQPFAIGIKLGDTQNLGPIMSCTTPSGYNGKCIEFQKCTKLVNLRDSPEGNTPEVLISLRKAHCGFNGTMAMVCCEDENSLLPNLQVCGLHTENKIYGGESTKLDEFPWNVLMEYKYPSGAIYTTTHATLISSKYVITLANHFTDDDGKAEFVYTRVVLGEYDVTTAIDCLVDECAPPTQIIDIESYKLHENFVPGIRANDIVLIRLAKEAVFSNFVRPICLPLNKNLANKDYSGKNLYFSGWGHKATGVVVEEKRKVRLPVHTKSACQKLYPDIDSEAICAGGVANVSSCINRGAPLVALETIDGRSNWYMVGMKQYLHAYCGTKGWPAVFVRVGSFVDWIVKNMKP